MSKIIDRAYEQASALADYYDIDMDDIKKALNYAATLEMRLKSCASCKFNYFESPYCNECRMTGHRGTNDHYPLWELE